MAIPRAICARSSCRRAAGFLAAWLVLSAAPAWGKVAYPHKTLPEAYKAAGFDPAAKGCFVFVATADSHYGVINKAGISPIIDEINAMATPPRFFTIVGDMINDASLFFGQVPGKWQKARAAADFQALKAHLAKLPPEVPFWPILGNHDTYRGEADCELFRSAFPGCEPYGAFPAEVQGVHFIRLNGGPGGDIAGKQLQWLLQHTAKLPADKPVIVLVHQPSLGSVVRERGIARALVRAFAAHEGPVWQICGHYHRNSVRVFALPKTKIVQTVITRGTRPGLGTDCPGYWVFCMKDGKVHARIFRHLAKGYRLDAAPDSSRAVPIPQPFEGHRQKDLLLTVLVGQDDQKYRVKTDASDNVLDWAYVKELVYRLPMGGLPKEPTRVAILASVSRLRAKTDFRVWVSSDGKEWHRLELPRPQREVYTFDIPPQCRGGALSQRSLYVKIESEGAKSTLSVGGFALCE